MELEIQAYLRESAAAGFPADYSLHRLQNDYGINHNQHKTFPNLYSLKYDMIESPMGERIVQEARGIILDSADRWNVVARPFDKFFNIGEGRAATIDWDTAKVLEKLDGSLMIMYHYDGAWRVASSGTPDASGHAHGSIQYETFADLFWHTFETEGYWLPYEWYSSRITDWTFMFELMTPFNRVVVPHETCKLVLIGARNRVTGEEIPVFDLQRVRTDNHSANEAAHYAGVFKRVKPFDFDSHEDMMESIPSLDPVVQEGYVVVDGAFNRVKIKTPQYVALAHMRDSFNPKAAIEIVRTGETSEVGTYFPHYKAILDETKVRYDLLVESLSTTYERIKGIEVQKDFALEALKTPMSDCLFALRKGKAGSVPEYLRSCRVEALEDVLRKVQIPA